MSVLQEDAKKILPFVQAMAEGKTVQVLAAGFWQDRCTADGWSAFCSYRIKPDDLPPCGCSELEGLVGRTVRRRWCDQEVLQVTAISQNGHIHIGTIGYVTRECFLRDYVFCSSGSPCCGSK